jgi:hypothetical protein
MVTLNRGFLFQWLMIRLIVIWQVVNRQVVVWHVVIRRIVIRGVVIRRIVIRRIVIRRLMMKWEMIRCVVISWVVTRWVVMKQLVIRHVSILNTLRRSWPACRRRPAQHAQLFDRGPRLFGALRDFEPSARHDSGLPVRRREGGGGRQRHRQRPHAGMNLRCYVTFPV